MPRKPRTHLEKLKGAITTKTAMSMLNVKNASQMAMKLDIEHRAAQRYLTGDRGPKQLLIALKEKYHDIYTVAIQVNKYGPYGIPLWAAMEQGNQVLYTDLRKVESRLNGDVQACWFELIMIIKIAAQTNKLNFRYGNILHFCAVTIVLNILRQMKNRGEISKKVHLLFVSALFIDVLDPFNLSRMDIDPLFFSENKDMEEWVRGEEEQLQETFDDNKILTGLWLKTAKISYNEAIREAGLTAFFEAPFKFCERATDYRAYFQHAPEKLKKSWERSFKK